MADRMRGGDVKLLGLRAPLLDGAASTTSHSASIGAGPVLPKPTVTSPNSRAACSAAITFGERPEVEIAMNTSPLFPRARSWRSNTCSKP